MCVCVLCANMNVSQHIHLIHIYLLGKFWIMLYKCLFCLQIESREIYGSKPCVKSLFKKLYFTSDLQNMKMIWNQLDF